ncbi:MAG TPA: hypothetical protein VFG09_15030 [Thermodesulfovibrionales bacterium]|jgi:hypothetical protein|nr:hypothetical protein [Thermodesulfovibrionales bacterium]
MMARIITYECEECGHRIVSTPTGETRLEPIYCCGAVVTEISSGKGKEGRQKKTTKRTAKKEVPQKKKRTAKKKSPKK